jgi:hypothetical protein
MTSNKHASIRSRITKNGKLRTETHRRDSGIKASISTHAKTNNTVMFLDFEEEDEPGAETTLRLSGREARTLYRLLSKHYEFVGR